MTRSDLFDLIRYVLRQQFARWVLASLIIWLIVGLTIRSLRRHGDEDTTPLRTDTATAIAYRKTIDDLERKFAEKTGMLASVQRELEGIRKLRPGVRTVYDTTFDTIPMPVFVHVGIRNGNEATALYLVPDSNGGFRPVRDSAINFTNCDERLDFYNGKVRCDPARLGHLGLFVGVGASTRVVGFSPPFLATDSLDFTARVGIKWRPNYRSPTELQLSIDQRRRTELWFEKGVWF